MLRVLCCAAHSSSRRLLPSQVNITDVQLELDDSHLGVRATLPPASLRHGCRRGRCHLRRQPAASAAHHQPSLPPRPCPLQTPACVDPFCAKCQPLVAVEGQDEGQKQARLVQQAGRA